MKNKNKALLSLVVGALTISASGALGAPVAGQITAVAVYNSTPSAFGLAYDSANNLIWYTEGDSGDNVAHSLKTFASFTPAELAGLTQTGGVYNISLAQGLNDVAGTTSAAGSGGFGSGLHFSSLAYDATSGQLVAQTGTTALKSFDVFTGANLNSNYAPGSANDSFSDGLDINGSTVWYSPDIGPIYKNGVLFADAASTNLALAGTGVSVIGFSGVQQIGSTLFAVGVGSFGAEERSILKFDALTGELLGYDPDGDPLAVRWEDLAFDGRYLYAADLRGNRDGTGPAGDIYVFDTGGGIIIPPNGTPDGGSTLVMLLGAVGSFGLAKSLPRRRQTLA